MQLTKTLIIGQNTYQFTFEGADLHEALMESQKVSLWDIDQCGVCGSSNLKLHAYTTKEGGYKYVKVGCNKCKASLTLGQAKKDNAYYYRRDEVSGNLDWKAFEEKQQ